jgi:hypothetical protein
VTPENERFDCACFGTKETIGSVFVLITESTDAAVLHAGCCNAFTRPIEDPWKKDH